MAEIERYLQNVVTANEPSVLAEEPARILEEIHGKSFLEEGGEAVPFLTDDEYVKLSIRKGSLDESERKEIESHVTHTFCSSRPSPGPRRCRTSPPSPMGTTKSSTATGTPAASSHPQIPIQTRMMTVSDIFDALTASDRPYKRAVPAQKALDILNIEVKEKKLDADLVSIFIEAKIWEKKPDLVTG